MGADVRRKVFRIEQMMAGRHLALPPTLPTTLPPNSALRDEIKALHAQFNVAADPVGDPAAGLTVELAQIRDAIAQHKRDLSHLIRDGEERRMVRANHELGAAVDGMETATERILKAAEQIDDSAKALTAALLDRFKRGMAQDIQDQVVAIFEACNFQDLAGQRIGKVMTTLDAIEHQVSAMLARYDSAAAPAPTSAKPAHHATMLNGPKLDGDRGHASQHDIDKMFG
jgi:chemotaxis protein CheZ